MASPRVSVVIAKETDTADPLPELIRPALDHGKVFFTATGLVSGNDGVTVATKR